MNGGREPSEERRQDVPVAAWSAGAPAYRLQHPLEQAALAAALDLADPSAGDRLLDIATGTGMLLRQLTRRPRPPVHAVGLDASSEMLSRVPRLPPLWRLVQADARLLPFETASFEVVSICFFLQTLTPATRAAVLLEARRVLADSGRIVVVTPSTPRSRALRVLGTRLLARAQRSSGTLGGMSPLDPRQALVSAGFDVAASRRTARGYPALSTLARPSLP